MTRIIAGAARGRQLTTLRGATTRPTSDRVREALFSSVMSQVGTLEGLNVVDLYAGSGALGLEALSRGAQRVTFVEKDAAAARVIRANMAAVDIPGAEIIEAPVERVLKAAPLTEYDVVLADPPYSLEPEKLTDVLSALTNGWLDPDALLVVERSRRSEPVAWPAGIVGARNRHYGETMLWYGHVRDL